MGRPRACTVGSTRAESCHPPGLRIEIASAPSANAQACFGFLPNLPWVDQLAVPMAPTLPLPEASAHPSPGAGSGRARRRARLQRGLGIVALSFNGTTAKVTVADSASLRLTSGMTVEAWVFPTAVTSTWRDVLVKGNTWTHLATTYDGSLVRLYVNGVQVSSATATGPITTSTRVLGIGGDPIYGQYFAGRIDEVRIYNVALSAAQIQTDMTTPIGP